MFFISWNRMFTYRIYHFMPQLLFRRNGTQHQLLILAIRRPILTAATFSIQAIKTISSYFPDTNLLKQEHWFS